MNEYLVRHALENVWCNPYQDRQTIIQLHPLTRHGGVRRNFSYLRRVYDTPTTTDYYHVYSIGQTRANRLNLPTDKVNQWLRMTDVCLDRSLLAEFYTQNGLQFCRKFVYVMYTDQQYYMFAVRRQDKIANLDNIDLFLRLQSNSFFNSVRDDDGPLNIELSGMEVTLQNISQLPAFQREYHLRRDSQIGHAYAFKNGRYVKDWLPADIRPGDIIEWVHDTSVREVHDIFINETTSYMSELDSKRKHLIHLPKSMDRIDYRDDIDIYIVRYSPSGLSYDGIYYHKNLETSIRMVTHRDYGVPEDLVANFIADNPGWTNYDYIALRMHVKNSGYDRPLMDEHHRIKEFYSRFDDADIVDVMTGEDAVLSEWMAPELEKSSYTRIMRSLSSAITAPLVMNAYGYNAMAKITADTPAMVVEGSVKLPFGLRNDSTVFEFNAMGLLLGWHYHEVGNNYYPHHSDCVMVEALTGEGSLSGGLQLGRANVELSPDNSYRFYITRLVNGVSNGIWEDVTGNTAVVTIVNDVAIWNLPNDYIGCVKSDAKWHCYDFEVESDDYTYNLYVDVDVLGNPLTLPGGKLDIFMNGRALIRGVDYFLNGLRLYIVNKRHLKPGNKQKLTVRMTGFCNDEMQVPENGEIGWVDHGYVSVNDVYNVREDKVIRCVVSGRTYHRSQIEFAEDRRLFTVPSLINGRPYAIENVDQAVRGLIAYDAYPLIASSKDLDGRISAYLTERLPDLEFDTPNVIPELYQLVSPLIARLIWEFKNAITIPLDSTATDAQLDSFISGYQTYLTYDPAYKDVFIDYVEVVPHPFTEVVSVSQGMYVFLERIIKRYLNERIDLTNYVVIGGA